MGSGHFLVAAIDRIDKRFSTYLYENPIPDVTNELARLREHATEILADYGESLKSEDTDKLRRRQIARRCIYGVDLNPLAVELARLSIWVHTFVPGLPLSLLDYNLVRGNSLVGIATIQEAQDILDQAGQTLFTANAQDLLGAADVQLERIRGLADADASQIEAARDAYEEARELLAPSAALFDILAASRLNDELRESIALGLTSASEDVRQGLPEFCAASGRAGNADSDAALPLPNRFSAGVSARADGLRCDSGQSALGESQTGRTRLLGALRPGLARNGPA